MIVVISLSRASLNLVIVDWTWPLNKICLSTVTTKNVIHFVCFVASFFCGLEKTVVHAVRVRKHILRFLRVFTLVGNSGTNICVFGDLSSIASYFYCSVYALFFYYVYKVLCSLVHNLVSLPCVFVSAAKLRSRA